jgi:hypothetical protein
MPRGFVYGAKDLQRSPIVPALEGYGRVTAIATVASTLFASTSVWADSGSTTSEKRSSTDATQQATNPVPTVTQLSFEPEYTFPNGQTRYVAQLLVEPIVPYKGFLVPDLDVPGFRSVARLELNAMSLDQVTAVGRVSASGLSDLDFADAVVHDFGPLEVGVGFGTVFPMATNPALGQGKWQLGPAAIVAVLDIPHLQIGAVGQMLWSVAGDSQRPALAYATIQPIVAVLLPGDCSVFTNDQMSFYWEGSGTTVPVNLGFGHGFSERFVGQVEGAYTASGAGKGNIQGVLVLNFQP